MAQLAATHCVVDIRDVEMRRRYVPKRYKQPAQMADKPSASLGIGLKWRSSNVLRQSGFMHFLVGPCTTAKRCPTSYTADLQAETRIAAGQQCR